MRIAIPTNNREELFPRTGQAKEFAIYDIEYKTALFIEFRENPHKHEDEKEEDHDHNHRDMVASLSDCKALLVKMAGKHLKKDFKEAKMPLFKTRETQLMCIATTFAKEPEKHLEI